MVSTRVVTHCAAHIPTPLAEDAPARRYPWLICRTVTIFGVLMARESETLLVGLLLTAAPAQNCCWLLSEAAFLVLVDSHAHGTGFGMHLTTWTSKLSD